MGEKRAPREDVLGALTTGNGTKRNFDGSCTLIYDGHGVRVTTPLEWERALGFPDNFTNIPWRGKPTAPDGPRYKALGNSMAVNVMRWIGQRIAHVDAIDVDVMEAAE